MKSSVARAIASTFVRIVKRKGKKVGQPSTSNYDRNRNTLNKAIRNCLILYTSNYNFFLFEYKNVRFIVRDDFESEIFIYQRKKDQKFLVDETLLHNEAFFDVLYKKYYECLENNHVVEYEYVLANELMDISKKRLQHVEVILAIKNLRF